MKNNKLSLKFQIFCLTTLTSALLSFLSVSTVLCISFHLTRASAQNALEQDGLLMLNRMIRIYEEKDSRPLLFEPFHVIISGNSQKRIMLMKMIN